MPHDFRERMNRAVDQPRAVVSRNDMDTLRQTGLKLLNLFLDTLGDGKRIFTMSHQDGATCHFTTVFFKDAAAKLRSQLYCGDCLDVDRSTFDLLDDRIFDVI